MRALGFQLIRAVPLRRDRSPSRWNYRWQRMMLTPLIRRFFRVGLPVFTLSLIAGMWSLSDANRTAMAANIATIRSGIENRPEFLVASLQVTGAEPALLHAVEGLVTVTFPVSSFDLDLPALRASIIELSAVKDATVRIRPGGILEVAVTERVPVAVWRYTDGLRLIDSDGMMTGMILARSDRADLPLIAGDGAKDVIAEALTLFQSAALIAPRVRGLLRMGERRWDMVLDRDQRILLPADDPAGALARVIALQQAQQLLDRDIAVVDMRDADRPTLRLGQSALNVMRNVGGELEEAGQ